MDQLFLKGSTMFENSDFSKEIDIYQTIQKWEYSIKNNDIS